jgi:hypothetical protein
MDEGWLGNDYLILFAASELRGASERYTISDWLPGYEVVGLRGWDDLILRDAGFRTYSIPAVPLDLKYLEPFALPECGTTLEYNQRFAGKIKWYVHPLVFGGEVTEENTTWVDHPTHGGLVGFWNKMYRSIKPQVWPL